MTHPVATGPALELTPQDLLHLRPWTHAIEDPTHPTFARLVDGQWREITAREHLTTLVATAGGLLASGVGLGDRVALLSATRYEWTLLDEAIWTAGGITVPIYPSSSPSQIEWIVRDSGARLLLVESPAHAAAVAELGLDVETLVIDDGAIDTLRERGSATTDEEVVARRDEVDLDAIATLVYTSGTTGRPKGVVLTHRHLAAEVKALLVHPIGAAAGGDKRVLMFLPLAHVLARAVTYTAAVGRATVGFLPDTSEIAEQIRVFAPHLILGVPRVFEKLHDGIRAQAQSGGRVPGAAFARGEQVAIAWSQAKGGTGLPSDGPGLRLRTEHAVLDRVVYAAIREALGGSCEYAISGGGALGERLGHFFRGIGVPVYEGYGLTETCAAITVNGPGCHRVGSVGVPIAGSQVRISDDGEIELHGEVVMSEYWGNPDASAEAVDADGWLRTGDLGRLDGDYLTITGRAKEIIVTAGGKNVAPGPLEDILRGHPLVADAMVIGEGRPYVAALIVLDRERTEAWAAQRSLTGDLPTLLASDAVRTEIEGLVDTANASVSRAEGIRRFELLTEEFSEERGEVTATLKLRRHVISETRAEAITALYGS